MKTWVLVAHRAGARLFEAHRQTLDLIEAIEHPEGRLKDGDIDADRPGRAFDRVGRGRHSQSVDELPHDRIAASFARQLAARLSAGRARDGVERILLVAEPRFLGMLRGALDDKTAAIVASAIAKDLARVDDRNLLGHLDDALSA